MHPLRRSTATQFTAFKRQGLLRGGDAAVSARRRQRAAVGPKFSLPARSRRMRDRVRRQSSSQSPGDRCRCSTIALVAAGSVRTRRSSRVRRDEVRDLTITSPVCLRGRVSIWPACGVSTCFLSLLRRVAHTTHVLRVRARFNPLADQLTLPRSVSLLSLLRLSYPGTDTWNRRRRGIADNVLPGCTPSASRTATSKGLKSEREDRPGSRHARKRTPIAGEYAVHC